MSKVIFSKKTILPVLAFMLLLAGCKGKENDGVEVLVEQAATEQTRSDDPGCLLPTKGGEILLGDEELTVDATNASDGYFYITYSGSNSDVKLQLSTEGSVTYTYKIQAGDMVLPLSLGAGEYTLIAYEGIGNGMYSARFSEKINVENVDEFGPFLYPNYFVNFSEDSEAVELGSSLASGKSCDLEVIAAVYEYVIQNITYDYDKASNVASDYVPEVDAILEAKKGICFDYAALMASMLRSQKIPTRLEMGYAKDAYHAWISCFVKDKGWINGMIKFDGTGWTLMDPTFAANSTSKELKKFIGDGDNYTTKYIY